MKSQQACQEYPAHQPPAISMIKKQAGRLRGTSNAYMPATRKAGKAAYQSVSFKYQVSTSRSVKPLKSITNQTSHNATKGPAKLSKYERDLVTPRTTNIHELTLMSYIKLGLFSPSVQSNIFLVFPCYN